jgi:hypothetical protein
VISNGADGATLMILGCSFLALSPLNQKSHMLLSSQSLLFVSYSAA